MCVEKWNVWQQQHFVEKCYYCHTFHFSGFFTFDFDKNPSFFVSTVGFAFDYNCFLSFFDAQVLIFRGGWILCNLLQSDLTWQCTYSFLVPAWEQNWHNRPKHEQKKKKDSKATSNQNFVLWSFFQSEVLNHWTTGWRLPFMNEQFNSRTRGQLEILTCPNPKEKRLDVLPTTVRRRTHPRRAKV